MLEERIVYRNGEFVPWDRASVHMMSHSFGRGSAVFEVLSVHQTPSGPVLFRLDDHVARLRRSARLLEMELPLDGDGLARAACRTVRRNGIQSGFVKIMGYFPQVALGILPPGGPLELSIFALDPAEDFPGLSFALERGTRACLSRWRKLDPRSVPVTAKAAANYLNGMVARQEAVQRGFDYAILLDHRGCVAEGGTESVFLVKEGRLATPALGSVLEGITRDSLLQVAADIGLPVGEKRLLPADLEIADEIFLAGTPAKVLPVRRMEDRSLSPVPGPVTTRLAEQMGRIVAGSEKARENWLTPV